MIEVNGERRALEAPITIAVLLGGLDVPADGRGIAVAVDAEVVPRAEWAAFTVTDGARVEILSAVQGG